MPDHPLHSLPLIDLHLILIKSNKLSHAKRFLKNDKNISLELQTLPRFLAKIVFPDKRPALSFTEWQNFTPEEARRLFGNSYLKAPVIHQIDMNELISQEEKDFFTKILKCPTLNQAAGALGVHHSTLKKHAIAKFFDKNPANFTYSKLQDTARKKMAALFPQLPPVVSLSPEKSPKPQNNISSERSRSSFEGVIFETPIDNTMNTISEDIRNILFEEDSLSAIFTPPLSNNLNIEQELFYVDRTDSLINAISAPDASVLPPPTPNLSSELPENANLEAFSTEDALQIPSNRGNYQLQKRQPDNGIPLPNKIPKFYSHDRLSTANFFYNSQKNSNSLNIEDLSCSNPEKFNI